MIQVYTGLLGSWKGFRKKDLLLHVVMHSQKQNTNYLLQGEAFLDDYTGASRLISIASNLRALVVAVVRCREFHDCMAKAQL